MTPECAQLDAFLDRRLAGPALLSYEQHWQGCDSCSGRVRHWRSFERAAVVSVQASDNSLPLLTSAKAAALVARARQQRSAASWRVRVLSAVAVCAVVALSAAVWFRAPKAPVAPTWDAPMLVLDASAQSVAAVGATLEAPADAVLRAHLGGDRLALASGSRVKVTKVSRSEVRLQLDQGAIALDIKPRAEGETLWVDAGGVTVRVIGTRFRVTREGGVSVLVNHGRVRVTDAQGLVREVGTGELLTIDESETRLGAALAPLQRRLDGELDGFPAAAPEATEKRPTRVKRGPIAARPTVVVEPMAVDQSNPLRLEGWRNQVANGRFEAARVSLAAHLKIAPRDYEAWLLIGKAQLGLGQSVEARASFEKVLSLSQRSPEADEAGDLLETLH